MFADAPGKRNSRMQTVKLANFSLTTQATFSPKIPTKIQPKMLVTKMHSGIFFYRIVFMNKAGQQKKSLKDVHWFYLAVIL